MSFLGFFWFAALILIGLFLVLYVLSALGLMKIAEKSNQSGGWMAWIPILNFALIGKLAFNNIIVQWTLPILFILTTESQTTINGEIVSSGAFLPAPLDKIGSFIWSILTLICIYKIY